MYRTIITEEELRSIPSLHREMIKDVERLHELEARCVAVGSSLPAGERVQKSIRSTAGYYVEEAADLRAELEERDAELKDLKYRAAQWIRTLPSETLTDKKARHVLELRYTKAMTWELISDLTGLSIRRLHQMDRAGMAYLS